MDGKVREEKGEFHDAAERGESKSTTKRRGQTKGLRSPTRYKAASKAVLGKDTWAEKPRVIKKVKGVAIPDLGVFALLTSPALAKVDEKKREYDRKQSRKWYAENKEWAKEYNRTVRTQPERRAIARAANKAWRDRLKAEEPEKYEAMLARRREQHKEAMADPERRAKMKARMRAASKRYKATAKGKATVSANSKRRYAAKKNANK